MISLDWCNVSYSTSFLRSSILMFNVTVDYFLSSVGGDGLQSVKSFCSVQIFFLLKYFYYVLK